MPSASSPTLPAALITLAPTLIFLLPALMPRSLALRHGKRLADWTARAAILALTLAVLAATVVLAGGVTAHVPAGEALLVSVRLDVLTAVMLVLVCFLAAVVTRYAVNYLDGDPRHGRFAQGLALTAACVSLLVVSGNLLQIALAWVATSLSLHKLLVFYPERREAVAAARLKFYISRLADAFLLAACVRVWRSFGTLEFDELFAQIAALNGSVPAGAGQAALFLVGAALLKSAQFPFHSWLPETQDAPTPVSALMHAGIINAGGFLVVRLSPLVSLSPASLNLLALVGVVSALTASLVMMTQSSIKKALAWSTISQMGFMMLQCGLGAYALAMLHIVAHSLYKSHAFLSSGGIVALARSAWTPGGRPAAHPAVLLFVLCVAVGATVLTAWLLGISLQAEPGLLVLASIFVMAMAYMLWNLWSTRFPLRLAVAGVVLAFATSAAWFAAHAAAHALFEGTVAAYAPERTTSELVVMAGVVLAFMMVLMLQASLPVLAARRGFRRFYVLALNGFYLGHWLRRLTATSSHPARI